ncbi:hypothetical protein NW844_00835 [Synechococcus sp. H55.2]|uniref:hypothetical protein n=1 Tax=unclassified Synechococcus TaxID=2626047 RepID=UPI0039C21607
MSAELWQNRSGVEVPDGIPLVMKMCRPAFLCIGRSYPFSALGNMDLDPVPLLRTERYG